MKIGIGLVIKGGKQFIDKWMKNLDNIPHEYLFVVDNGADKEVWEKLAFYPKLKGYLIQKDLERNQSRDYQKILDMAREENIDWIWNIDIDEIVPKFDINSFLSILLNSRANSISFPLVEVRENNKYLKLHDQDGSLKHGRLCHKLYKTLSHLQFNLKDVHGTSVPPNCDYGPSIDLPIFHYGHSTKELRKQKRDYYIEKEFKDETELTSEWLKEDDEGIVLNDLEELPWKI